MFLFLFFLLLIAISWICFLLFIKKVLRFSIEHQLDVLKKMNQIQYYLGTLYWIRNPENEQDPQKKVLKKKKLFFAVRSMTVWMAIFSLVVFILGLIYLKSYFYGFLIFSFLFSPFVGLLALYFGFMWYLMEKCNYLEKQLINNDDL